MKNSALKWLSNVTGKKKIYIVILLVIQAALGISSVIYALFLRNIIDAAVEKNEKYFFLFLLLLTGLVIFQIAMRAVVRFLEEYSKSTFENLLKGKLFSSLLRKNYGSVTAVHSGEWLNRLTSDTVVIANGLVEIIPGIAGMAVKMTGALVTILALEPGFAYIIFPGGAALIFLTYGFRKRLKRLHKKIQEKDGKLRVFMQERLGSLMIVRSFAAQSKTEDECSEKMAEHKAARMKRNHFSNICNIGFAAAMNGMYLLGVCYFGYGILKGTVSYGTLMAVLQLINQIQSPFANISGYLPKFYAMTASAERVMETESFEDDCCGDVRTKSEVHEFYETRLKGIGFENAGFTYLPPDESADRTKMPVVLKNVSIEIKKGEYIAFTGHSGCGKSTLLKLMMCLYPLDEGERYLLTDDNQKIPLTSEWHRLFAYVPQGNYLMSGTIREVVAFADSSQKSDDNAVYNALRIACAEEFVNELEDGIDTFLGEQGKGLSEGQMQRIAIARAVFSDSPVLILDEATSSLDEQTERKVIENLKKMTDKTVLIITHRPAALEICDRIFEFSESGIKTIKKDL